MGDELQLISDANPAGEFSFTARGLFLSFHLGAFLALEQRLDDGLWSGASVRGDLKLLLPGEARTFRHARAAEFAHITIPARALDGFDVSPIQLRPHVLLRDATLRYLMEALLAEGALNTPSRMFAESVVQAILSRLLTLNGRPRSSPRHGLSPAALRRVLSLLEDNIAQNLSVFELARICDVSPSHFSSSFKLSVGEAPHRYQIRRRVERARALLLAAASPAEAAAAVGFCDQSHLGRHMRKLLGVSPATVARAAGAPSPAKRTGRRRNVL